MSGFRRGLLVEMKSYDTDSKLTDYLLGELSANDSAQVRDLAAKEPSVRAFLKETAVVHSTMSEVLGCERNGLAQVQRERIRKAAKEATRGGKIIELDSHRKHSRWGWKHGIAAAAAVALGAFLLTFVPEAGSLGAGSQVASAPVMPQEKILKVEQRDPLDLAGDSLKEIERSIRLDENLPSADVVDVSQILQEFPLRAKKFVSVADGCSLGAEVFQCPWDEDSYLVLTTIQGAREVEKSISVDFQAARQVTLVIDHSTETKIAPSPFSQKASPIKSGAFVSFVFEIRRAGTELTESDVQLGILSWSVNGKAASSLDLEAAADMELSKDARFASLVSAFGMWLQDQGGKIEADLVERLAQEVAVDNPAQDRYEFLRNRRSGADS